MQAIEVNDIKKSYKNKYALGRKEPDTGISFAVPSGELFGIIGPDGAGKTSLFRILTTLILPDSGTATVNRLDIIKDYKKIRKQIGYMPGRFSLYGDLSVEENLKFFASVFQANVQDNYYLIKDIYQQIEPFKDRKAKALSGGMKQKLALSCALIHKPSVLFLDEPTTGVDPVSRKEFWEMLKRLKNQGITILVSTPYMDEARLCDRIALIKEGEFIGINTPENIIANFKKMLWSVQSDKMYKLLTDLRSHPSVDSCFTFGETHHITLKRDDLTTNDLKQWLQQKGHKGIMIREIDASIEDCYMQLAQNG